MCYAKYRRSPPLITLCNYTNKATIKFAGAKITGSRRPAAAVWLGAGLGSHALVCMYVLRECWWCWWCLWGWLVRAMLTLLKTCEALLSGLGSRGATTIHNVTDT